MHRGREFAGRCGVTICMRQASTILREYGFEQYEISNYAKKRQRMQA